MCVALAAALFAGLLALHSGRLYSIDGLLYYRTAQRLVEAGSLQLDPPVRWGDPPGYRTSAFAIGYSIALTPGVALAGPLRDLQPPFTDQPYDEALLYGDLYYAAASWVNPLLAALTGAMVFVLARSLEVRRRLALGAGIATVVSGPLLWYARADFAQPLSAALLTATIIIVIHARRGKPVSGWLVPVLAWALLTRPVDGVLTAVVAAAGLFVPDWRVPSLKSRRSALAVGTGVFIGLLGLFAVNWGRRGSPLDFGYSDGFTGFAPAGLLAYLVSPGRGFAWHLPLAFLGLAGAVALWKARDRVHVTLLGLPFVLWLGVYSNWAGLSGWGYGPRFLVPLVPLAVTLAAVRSDRLPSVRSRRLFGGLAMLGAVLAASSVIVDQYRFFSIIGMNQWGMPGFWREFGLEAYAPIASWRQWEPTTLSGFADVVWFRLAESAGAHVLFVPLVLAAGAAACGALAFRWTANPRSIRRVTAGR